MGFFDKIQMSCTVREYKKYSYIVRLYQDKEQYGCDIICLRFGYLRELLEHLKVLYKMSDDDLYFLTQNKGENNVK